MASSLNIFSRKREAGKKDMDPRSSTSCAEPAVRGGIYPGWYAVGLGFLLQVFAAGPIYYAYGNYSAAFEEEFQASRTLINLAYSLVMLVGAIGSAPVGWLADRWPLRRIVLTGVIGTAAGLSLVSAATEMWQVVLLFGTLIAMSDVFIGSITSSYLVSRWFERRRGLALGLTTIGASVAAVAFPPLSSLLIESAGWRQTFIVYGISMLILVPPAMLFAYTPRSVPEHERKARAARPADGPLLTLRQMARIPAFWIITMCCGTMMGVNGALMISMVPYALVRGFDLHQGAALVSLIGAGAFIGKLSFGLVADHMDLRWAQRLGLLTMAIAIGLLVSDGGYALLGAASFIFGLGLGGMMPVWAALVAHIFGAQNCGSALGATRAAMTPLAIGGPMLTGFVVDLTGGYRLAWLLFLALLLSALALTFGRRNWGKPVLD